MHKKQKISVVDELKDKLSKAESVFLTDFKRDYAAMNAVYKSYFPANRLPARTCVGVTGLAYDALIEIDLVARRPS